MHCHKTDLTSNEISDFRIVKPINVASNLKLNETGKNIKSKLEIVCGRAGGSAARPHTARSRDSRTVRPAFSETVQVEHSCQTYFGAIHSSKFANLLMNTQGSAIHF